MEKAIKGDRQIDAGNVIDNAILSSCQIRVLITASLVMILEGIDIQCISFVAPTIVEAWGIEMGGFGIVFTAGLIGAVIGAAVFGPLGDKFGRKPIIFTNVIFFGVGTLVTPLASDIESLVIIRFLASLGLGGVTPNCIALVSEYAPTRFKALFISIIAVSPLTGGVLGGLFSRSVIPVYGWEGVFYIAGGVSIAALVPVIFLPESIRFLVTTRQKNNQIVKIMNRIDRSTQYISGDHFYLKGEQQGTKKLSDLFTKDLLWMTLLLWLALAANLFMMVLLINWLPLLLDQQGVARGTAILSVSILNFGGIAGGIALAIMSDRIGIYRTLFTASLFASLATALIGVTAPQILPMMACIFLSGFLGLGTYAGFATLAASVYPVHIRSTGIGWALSIGKCGAAIAPLSVSAALAYGLSIPAVYCAAGIIGLVATISIPLIYWRGAGQNAKADIIF